MIYNDFEAIGNLFIGGYFTKRERVFKWIDGTSVDYENWAPGEPNDGGSRGQYCVHMYTDGTWADIECDFESERNSYFYSVNDFYANKLILRVATEGIL